MWFTIPWSMVLSVATVTGSGEASDPSVTVTGGSAWWGMFLVQGEGLGKRAMGLGEGVFFLGGGKWGQVGGKGWGWGGGGS